MILDYVVRQELEVFSNEVIRFGNRSKDPQWRNLDCYFEKQTHMLKDGNPSRISREINVQRLSRDEPELIMLQLMTLADFTVVSLFLVSLKNMLSVAQELTKF